MPSTLTLSDLDGAAPLSPAAPAATRAPRLTMADLDGAVPVAQASSAAAPASPPPPRLTMADLDGAVPLTPPATTSAPAPRVPPGFTFGRDLSPDELTALPAPSGILQDAKAMAVGAGADVDNLLAGAGHQLHAAWSGAASAMAGDPATDEQGRPLYPSQFTPEETQGIHDRLQAESRDAAAKAAEAQGNIRNPVARAVAPHVLPMGTMLLPGAGPELASMMEAGQTYGRTDSLPRAALAGAIAEAGGRVPIGQMAKAAAPVLAKAVGKTAAPIVARGLAAAGTGAALTAGEQAVDRVADGKPFDPKGIAAGAGTFLAFDAGMHALHLAFQDKPIPQEVINKLRETTAAGAKPGENIPVSTPVGEGGGEDSSSPPATAPETPVTPVLDAGKGEGEIPSSPPPSPTHEVNDAAPRDVTPAPAAEGTGPAKAAAAPEVPPARDTGGGVTSPAEQPLPEAAGEARDAGQQTKGDHAEPNGVGEVASTGEEQSAPPAAESLPSAVSPAEPKPAARPRLKQTGHVAVPDVGKIVAGAKDRAQNLADQISVDAIPKLFRAGVGPEAVQHAKARDMTEPAVKDLLAKVFPDSYKDKEAMARTVDVLVKDNVLSGYHAAVDRGDAVASHEIAQRHDIDEYTRLVQSARFDPEISANIDRWKEHVNPTLDRLFAQMKGLDPNAAQEPRGHHFGARINLVDDSHAPAWVQAMKDGSAAMPDEAASAAAATPANMKVKGDKFDRSASFLGKYSTDPEAVLSSVLGRRFTETTKLKLYNALKAKGLAVEVGPGDTIPDRVAGKEPERLEIAVPETHPETGRTRSVNRKLFVPKELYHELRDVLATDPGVHAPALKGIANFLNKIQVAGVGDFVAHGFNMNRVVGQAMGDKSFAGDAFRKLPAVGSVSGLIRTMSVMREIAADTPEIRAELAGLTKKGFGRGYYPHGAGQIGGRVLTKMDQSSRVIMSRFYDHLVDRGLAVGTDADKYKFIAQVGEYNKRLIGPVSRTLRDSGFSPFVVAGKTMNRMGRRAVTGNPGFEAKDKASWAKARALGLTTMVAGVTMPMMLNAITTGKVMGRSGTPVGAWDTGHDNEDGTHRVVDLLQLTGARRGLRSMGLNAVMEGLSQGKDENTILGNAATDIVQSAMHPIMGPAPAFTFKAVTGMQPDLRGHMDAQKIPEGGPKQAAENVRAALASQNPLIYNVLQPALRAAGIDQTPKTKSYGASVAGDGLTKQALSSGLGIKDVRPGQDAAEDMAERLARAKFGSGSATPEDAQKMATKRDLLNAIHAHPEMGEAVLAHAVEGGALSTREAALLKVKAGSSSLQWNFRSLDAEDAAKVYGLATPQQRETLREEFQKKVLASPLAADRQDKLLADAKLTPPVDLALTRELHALNVKAAATEKAVQAYRGLRRQATVADQAGDDAKGSGLRRQGYATYQAAKLTPEDAVRRSRLMKVEQGIREIRERVKDGAMTKERGEDLIGKYLARAGLATAATGGGAGSK